MSLNLFFACTSSPDANQNNHQTDENVTVSTSYFGLKEIDDQGAVNADALIAQLDAQEGLSEIRLDEETVVQGIASIKVEGEVLEVCQGAGCWFTLKNSEGVELFIQMKEHKSVPKDCSGKKMIAEGMAFAIETSIEVQKETLKAEGASQEQIDGITAPLIEYQMIAVGARLKQ